MSNPPGQWQPLSARTKGSPVDASWHEGVPSWIDRPLRAWLAIRLRGANLDRLMARFRYTPEGDNGKYPSLYVAQIIDEFSAEYLLDWIDATLHIESETKSSSVYSSNVDELDTLLLEGRSVWRVSDGCDALVRRQDKTVTEATGKAAETAVEAQHVAAGEHLREAWEAVYGRNPDPSKGYREAILAIEGASIPAILPNHASATLGHVLGQLDHQGHLYRIAINDKAGAPGSVAGVVELLRIIWEGHTDRHEGNTPTIPITQEAAEMALHLAATLVQWFSSGAIFRK